MVPLMFRLPKIGERLLSDNGYGLLTVAGVIAYTNPHEYDAYALYVYKLNDEDPENYYIINHEEWNEEFQGWVIE